MSEYAVPIEEALERLAVEPEYDDGNGPRPCVHTFLSTPLGLIGAHWPLTKVEEEMRAHGVEESGDQAQAMGHGLVIVQGNGLEAPLFLATRTPEKRTTGKT